MSFFKLVFPELPSRENRDSFFDLIRLPAALSVPGDTLAGASAAALADEALPLGPALGFAAASCCLYWAGMSLNDYVDRDVDAIERPQRPIPSGRIQPKVALRIAQGFTVAGTAIAGIAGITGGKKGKQSVIAASTLASAVWAYNLSFKNTKAGPSVMAMCRALDVLMGASRGSILKALPASAIVGAHTLALTTVSQCEVEGGNAEIPRRAGKATAAIAGVASAYALNSSFTTSFKTSSKTSVKTKGSVFKSLSRFVSAISLVGLFAKPVLEAQTAAVNETTPKNMQRVVGTSIYGMIPLQGSVLAGKGRVFTALLISSGWPIARNLARKRAVT